MIFHPRSLQAKLVALLVFISLFTLSACSGVASSSGSSSSSSGTPATKGPLTVTSKKDVESQLLAEMYSLLLQKGGFKVNTKLSFGITPFNFQALKNGDSDLYPEFTATGLNTLGISSTYDPEKDYQNVKQGFKDKYNIIWLDQSPLNDGYALCTSKQLSQSLGITTISQVVPKVKDLILESPSDGIAFIDNLQKTYGFTTKSFKKTQTVDYAIGFSAVQANQAQLNVCYGTDASVPKQNFVFLQDDKNGFPAFNPAPIVRGAVLAKYPEIASILNPLAPKLTTDVSIQLQTQVQQQKSTGASETRAVQLVATNFLKQNKLL